jgi:hypothetical protein
VAEMQLQPDKAERNLRICNLLQYAARMLHANLLEKNL